MRILTFAAAAILFQAIPALAQQTPLGTGLNSGLGSEVRSGLGGGVSSGLGIPDQRTLADSYDQFGKLGSIGNTCAPGQLDPDRKGCRPQEDLLRENADPNRVVTYTGDSAFRSSSRSDPNRPF